MAKRTCSVDGCTKRHGAKGFCPMHYQRWKKHGDVHRVDRGGHAHPKGPANPKWLGDNVGYAAIHDRLASHRTKPVTCPQCGGPGPIQWALNWDTVSADDVRYEKRRRRGKVDSLPYSVNLDDYIALCCTCHRRFDLDRNR